MPWGAVIGGALSYFGSKKSADAQEDAANKAAQAGAFKPYNVYSGYGSATFTPGSAGTAATPGFMTGGWANDSQSGSAGPPVGQTWHPGTDAIAAVAPSATATLSPEYQKIRDQYLQQAGGYNDALTNYSPEAAAQSLYEKMQAISAPDDLQARNAYETRLLSQGQMGLQQGGSNPLMQSYLSAEKTRNLQREVSAFGMSQDVLNQLQNRSLAATSGASGIDALPLQQLSLGGVFGGMGTQASQFGANLQNQAAMNSADSTAQLWAGIGQQVGPAAGQAIGNYFNSQYSEPYNPNKGSYGGIA